MDPSNLVTMMLNPAFRLFSAAYAITFPLILIALVALYRREAQDSDPSWSTRCRRTI
jgi:hypothetical protein